MLAQPHVPELLAPAGDLECLHAAVRSGADAVYLGLGEFNARRNAGNFTLEELGEACDYAHLRGTSVYVTMNVEVLPGEVSAAIGLACAAYERGADAFIVQDIGLAAELRRTFPALPVHASTQMNIHNAAGVEAAAALGMTRVTLARELGLAEIAEIAAVAAAFGMEAECFAHGALCICYSGQCLMSSMIGGRSANRGLCAQACRLPYELYRDGREKALPSEGDHLLSPRDLCALDLLEDLRDAGVASLKIEGRMKSADYVHEVVSVYREALDALPKETPPDETLARFPGEGSGGDMSAGEPENAEGGRDEHRSVRRDRGDRDVQGPSGVWQRRLAEAFSRGFTTAYLEGDRGNNMMSYGRPNNRGVFVGRVARADDAVAEVSTEMELHAGDVLEFWTNRGHFAAGVDDDCPARGTARIRIEQRVGKGDRVFRVRNAASAFVDDPFEPRVPVDGNVILEKGEPACISFASRTGKRGMAQGAEVEAARTKPLNEEDVRAHVDRLGQTPFMLDRLDVEMDEGIGMGFSQLHHLRSDALENLRLEMLEPWRDRSVGPWRREESAPSRGGRAECRVVAWASNPGCARAAKRAGADDVYVPLLNFRRGQAQVCGAREEAAEQAGYPKQCVMALAAVDHDPIPQTREGGLAFDPWDYVREGKAVFADSLAGAMRALGQGAAVEIGPHVPVMNAEALRFVAELGVSRVWLSPELTLGQIAELAENSPVELGLFVVGAQELMICEHCLLMSQGPCAEDCETCPRRSVAHRLVDRKGFEFPVVTDMLGRSHLYNGIELDALSSVPDLVELGVSAVMVDTTLMDRKAAGSAVSRAVRAVDLAKREKRSVDRRPGTTTGHLFRGVS